MLLDYIGDGVQIIDAQGHLVYSNKPATMLDDINLESALGEHLLKVYPSLTEKSSTLLKVLHSGVPILDYQQSYSTYKGKEVTTVNSTLPIRKAGRLVGAVEISHNITEVKALSEKVVDLQKRVCSQGVSSQQDMARFTFADIITDDIKMLELKSLATKGAQTDAPVLVCGETGTGKELFVQAIHNSSRRRGAPFIAQNCAALPTTLLEGIIFGTMRGSFTGSVDRPGLFELADGGTLFLDEINSLPMELQAKFLRVLQEGTFRRIGDMRARFANVRIITAMNTKPEDAVRSGVLRQDLFYRLNTITLNLPPLRQRKGDIGLLVKHFLKKYNSRLYKKVLQLSPEVMDRFFYYDWPGNVRELEHVIEGVLSVMDGNQILLSELPQKLREGDINEEVDGVNLDGHKSLKSFLEAVEKKAIEDTLHKEEGNVTRAANVMKLPRQTLQYKIKKYKINQKNANEL